MRKLKKKDVIVIIAGTVLLLLLAYIGFRILPKNRMLQEIANAMKPVIEASNQSLHLKLDATIDDQKIAMDSEIYLMQEGTQEYLCTNIGEFPIYITDNLLLFENGKAFKISEKIEEKAIDYKTLFSYINTVYKILDINCDKTEEETRYMVEVTGEELQTLLTLLPVENELLEGIENLQLVLVTRQNILYSIGMYGNVTSAAKKIEMNVLLSNFMELNAGSFSIPKAVKEAVANVDRDALFTLTEDLYRLIEAVSNLSKEEIMEGMAYINVNCGILNLNNSFSLMELQNNSGNSDFKIDKEQIMEVIVFLCIEGDISCEETKAGYRYELLLKEETMESIVNTFVPELSKYGVVIQNGSAYILLKEEEISSINMNINGNISILMANIPASIGVEICFQ